MNFRHATPEQKERFEKVLKMYEAGMTQRAIAAEFEVSQHSISKWINRGRKERIYQSSLKRRK